MLQNLGSCVLLESFTNFSVDPYYDPLSLVMIIAIGGMNGMENSLVTE